MPNKQIRCSISISKKWKLKWDIIFFLSKWQRVKGFLNAWGSLEHVGGNSAVPSHIASEPKVEEKSGIVILPLFKILLFCSSWTSVPSFWFLKYCTKSVFVLITEFFKCLLKFWAQGEVPYSPCPCPSPKRKLNYYHLQQLLKNVSQPVRCG